ncbi:MAG: gluconolactonase [Chthonomonadaceae bacterium]|nr:gluconolactonase [Chthonomonadaceae bacterium]
MKFRTFTLCAALALLGAVSLAGRQPAHAADDYKLGPDSMEQPGVPKGDVTYFKAKNSKVFPGSEHDVWVYVPKQYDASKPACVMIFQDGGGFQDRNGGFRVPVVFDNLIAKKQMPVTVAIMINPGVVPAAGPNALPRYNRSFEYDDPTDRYARFLLEEILPEVGKKVNLSQNPDDRGLCGASSGGIASFVAAWTRPDQFHRVISYIGSFTDLRGGNTFASDIRKYEPRPLRVFMQDGTADQDIYSGNWYIGNQDVAAALRFARNDMQFVVGTQGHSGQQGASILPDALRWLWRDYPAPIRPATSTPQPIMRILLSDEVWQPVTAPFTAGALAADSAGNVYVTAHPSGQIHKISPDGTLSLFVDSKQDVSALAFGPDGKLYAAQNGAKRIVAYDATGKETVIARGVTANGLTIDYKGEIYLTDARDGKIYRIDKSGRRMLADAGLPNATGLALTPDQTLLQVTTPGKLLTCYQIQPDGALGAKQEFFDIHISYNAPGSGADGMTTDTLGWLYVATQSGIQVLDQAGRVNGIIANPDRRAASAVVFGGVNHDILTIVAEGKIFRRATRAKGVLSSEAPIKPPGPRL